MASNPEKARDRVLTTLAVLIGLLALSNFSKPLGQAMQPEGNAGFVFFGYRLHGVANAVMGPLFGCVLAAYAYGVWTLRRWVVPLAGAYAVYVVFNLILFALHPPPGSQGSPIGLLVYAAVAVGGSSGGAYYLYRSRDRLR
jgi:hypothetical protein